MPHPIRTTRFRKFVTRLKLALFRPLSDRMFVKLRYFTVHGRFPNLDRPTTYSEKIQMPNGSGASAFRGFARFFRHQVHPRLRIQRHRRERGGNRQGRDSRGSEGLARGRLFRILTRAAIFGDSAAYHRRRIPERRHPSDSAGLQVLLFRRDAEIHASRHRTVRRKP